MTIKNENGFITKEAIKEFEMIFPLISTMHSEMKTLSSKKQETVLNELKSNVYQD